MKRTRIALAFAVLMVFATATAQNIPARPVPPRLVNDYTSTLSVSQAEKLERKLVAYNDSTSTQIAVVLVGSLDGYPIADYAHALAESWGVGGRQDNGILILVKPKNKNKGEARIEVGYGMESIITDAMAKRIIETLMIPEFKDNRYYTGIDKAVDRIISLASGEYKSNESDDDIAALIAFAAALGIILIIILILASGNNHRDFGGGSPTDDFLKGLFWGSVFGNASSRGGSSWGSFGGGGGSFGGGGFGGFGGGHFGGGGASGSW